MGAGESGRPQLRTIICASAALAMLLTALPSTHFASTDGEKRTAETLANGSRVFNVGVVGYASSVATLNPFVSSSSAEFQTIWPCYSTLLTYDVNSKLVGDLATSWSLAPDGLTWELKLVQNAYFVDPAAPLVATHQVTAKDIMWTYWEVNNDTGNRLRDYLRGASAGVIDSMWIGTNQWQLHVKTKTPFAPFISALAKIPIVPEYVWGHLPAGKTPLNYANTPPIGSGAFYYGSTTLPTSIGILKRNPQWFQEANRGWQIHVDRLQYKNEISTDTAWTDLTANPPLIDTYLNVAPDLYLEHVVADTTPGLIGWAQNTGFVYEYQLNQLDPIRRTQCENAGLMKKGGTSNPLLINPTLKLAMAMCVDKQTFIDQALFGLGTVADSLVPGCNPWHYTYPRPVVYDPAAARNLLLAAGWDHDSSGNPATSTTVPLCRYGPSNHTVYQPLSFRLMTPNTNTEWATGAGLLAQWAAIGGIQLNISIYPMYMMLSNWYAGDYDTWLWDYLFTPTSDPSIECLSVDTSMAIGSWSGSYWHNASYDDLYNRSLTAMSSSDRRQLTNAMQASIYEDHNHQLVAYPKSLYVASTYYWNGSSYGDWAGHWTLIPDQGYPWLCMQLSPTDNHAPTVTVSSSSYIGKVDMPFSFSGSATDDTSTLKYQWYWGDGAVSGWQTGASTSHTYSTSGIFTAYLAAQEQGTADGFIGWNSTTVTVIGLPPVFGNPPITMSPATGITTATVVTFTAHATDPDGDPLYYTWDFGDTHNATGPVVTHQFTSVGTGTYTVNLTVSDMAGNPPLTAAQLVSVTLNHPPQLSIASYRFVLKNALTTFNASATDQDGDSLRFTWDWGDAVISVTTTPSATHTYGAFGFYTLVVRADDLTAIPGHNVSATEFVKVSAPPTPPMGVTLSVNPLTAWVGQAMSFTGSAHDPGGDAMTFNFTFGDGTYTVIENGPTTPNQVVTNQTTHTFYVAGTMIASMAASDGLSTTQSSSASITITLNHPPVVTPQPPRMVNAGTPVSFSATATDADGETLRSTWDFGDGSPLVVSNTTLHTYSKAGKYTFTVHVDDLTGLLGHNVSSSATASVAFNLPLAVGWNFASVPVTGYGYKASTIGLVTGDVVIRWNSTHQAYDNPYIKGISPPQNDFPILPNTGYWIWVAAAKTLHLYGSVPATWQHVQFSVPQRGGWIAVGLLGVDTVYHASDILLMTNGTARIVSMVVHFDPIAQTYQTWIPGLPMLDYWLIPGQAYWCWATQSGTLSYLPDK